MANRYILGCQRDKKLLSLAIYSYFNMNKEKDIAFASVKTNAVFRTR